MSSLAPKTTKYMLEYFNQIGKWSSEFQNDSGLCISRAFYLKSNEMQIILVWLLNGKL